MKTSSLQRCALLAGVLGFTGLTAVLAQDQPDSTAPPPPHHGHHDMLTQDERAELKKDRDAVFSSNPDLKTEEETLHQQMHDHMDKVDAAILKEDPAAAPILAKLKAAHHHGPPPGDDNPAP
jgi:hypothetical protein